MTGIDREVIIGKVKAHSQSVEALKKMEGELLVLLRKAMLEEIIPSVEISLPAGYSINRERSEVLSHSWTGVGIPDRFGIFLRLDYEGKPINTADEKNISSEFERSSSEKLEQLARDYGVRRIRVLN